MNRRQTLTPAQAATLLGLGKTTVLDWCAKGVLPHVRIESRTYLKRAELIRDGWLTPAPDERAGDGDLLLYDDGSVRPRRGLDADEREALERTHEPRTVAGREVFVPREGGDDDA
jgi:excisionase family DNA binding protein